MFLFVISCISILRILSFLQVLRADPSAVRSKGQQSDCWSRGLGSRWQHACSVLVFVCLVGRSLCKQLSFVQNSLSGLVFVSNCMWFRNLQTRRLRPDLGCSAPSTNQHTHTNTNRQGPNSELYFLRCSAIVSPYLGLGLCRKGLPATSTRKASITTIHWSMKWSVMAWYLW